MTLDLNEAALSTAGATGSNPSLTSEVDNTPALSFTAGSDNLTSFAFSGIGGLVTDLNGTGGQDIFWQLVSPTQIQGFLDAGHTQLAVTLDLSAPASIAAGATGNVTVTATLSDNLQHVLANGAQISSIGNVGVVATDTDGDTTTGTVNINVQDDIPTAVVPQAAVLPNGAGIPFPFALDNDLTLSNNYGADGGTVVFLPSLNGTTSGLTSHGTSIIYNVSADGHTLTGVAGPTTVFVITLDPATATYSVDMNDVVDSTTRVDFNAGAFNFVGGNNEWAEFIPLGETVGAPIDNNSSDLLLTPQINHQFASSINSNANDGGVGLGGNVGPVGGAVETFRIDFVTDLRGDPASTGPGDYGVLSKRDHVFDGHYTTNGASATFTATNGATVNIRAFDDPDTDDNVVGPGVNPDTLTGVAIMFGNNPPLFIDLTKQFAPSHNIAGHIFTVTTDGDGKELMLAAYSETALIQLRSLCSLPMVITHSNTPTFRETHSKSETLALRCRRPIL